MLSQPTIYLWPSYPYVLLLLQKRIDHMTDTITPSESRAAVYEVTAATEDKVRKANIILFK